MHRMRTFALQPVRNEMRGVSKNLCGEARGYNLLLLLHLHLLLSVSPWTSVVNSTQLISNCPAELPSSHLTSPPPRSLRLPLPIPVPQALLQRRAPYAQLMQLLARVPRSRPPPPLPLPIRIRPTLRAAIRPTSKSPRREPEPEPRLPRMYERRNPIERVARADAREAAQHDVVLVRERVERVERV